LAHKSDLQRQAENEDVRNRDLNGQVFERETKLRGTEDGLMVAKKE
jgi:hypothetical protein